MTAGKTALNLNQLKYGDIMITYTLILFFHVGAMGNGNSNATTVVDGFASHKECMEAGKEAKGLVSGSVKKLEYVCVKKTAK